jgi:hypothetical protein
MPVFKFTSPEGKTYNVTGPEGATKEQAFQILQKQLGSQDQGSSNTEKTALNQDLITSMMSRENATQTPSANNSQDLSKLGVGERALHILRDIPRGAGLTLRNTLEGIGNTVDFLGTPLAAGMAATGHDPRGGGKALADYLNLPQAEMPSDKILSEGQKIIAGSGGMIGLSKVAAGLAEPGGIAQKSLQAMAARPDIQLQSAAGAGLSGGYVKEKGGTPLEQTIASIIGGVAAPLTIAGTQKTYQLGKGVYDRFMQDPQAPAKIDIILNTALKEKGVSLGDLEYNIRRQLRDDMAKAMKSGDVSPDVVRRLADYRMTGLTPTAGPLTLDPGVVTRQKNLTKLGAASQDPKLQQLAQIQNQNNQKLIQNVNDLGANSPTTLPEAGQKVIGTLKNSLDDQKNNIDLLYKAARNSSGRSAALDPSHFSEKADILLREKNLNAFLPPEIKGMLNDFASGKAPLTVDTAEQFKTIIGTAQRSSSDGNIRNALGSIREALDNTKLLPGQGIGSETIKNFTLARQANKAMMDKIESIPALKAVYEGVEPDKFIPTFITGKSDTASLNNVKKLAEALKTNPEAGQAVKNSLAQFLKKAALGSSSDEVGNFSQAGYNRMLQNIGDDKLRMFFNDQEFKAIKAIGRVASYEQFQPTGSAVNNSNTATTAIATVLDKIGNSPFVRKFPYGAAFVGNPVKGVATNIEAGNLTKIPVNKITKENLKFPTALLPYLLSEKPDDN